MKFKQTVLASVALLMGAALSGPAFAVNDEPLTDNWAPSEWGPDAGLSHLNFVKL